MCVVLKQCLSVDMSQPSVNVDGSRFKQSRVNYFSQMDAMLNVEASRFIGHLRVKSHYWYTLHKIKKADLRFYVGYSPHLM